MAVPLHQMSEPEIIQAVIVGDIELVTELVEEDGVDVDTVGNSGGTALCYAVAHNQLEIATFLLNQGAELETRCTYFNIVEMTPYMIAVLHDNVPMMKLLLSRGALTNVIVGDEERGGAYNAFELVKKNSSAENLLTEVDTLNVLAQTGRNTPEDPLSLYRQMLHCRNQGASINQQFEENDNNNQTLLHIAVSFENEASLRALLLLGADPNIGDAEGLTPLMMATKQGLISMMGALLDHGAEFQTQTQSGKVIPYVDNSKRTCLMLAIRKNTDAAKYLVSRGVPVNEKNPSKVTPLMYAAFVGNLSFIQYLFEQSPEKPSLTAVNSKGQSVLMMAVLGKIRLETLPSTIVEYLIAKGANIEVTDKKNKTALDYAKAKGLERTVNILKANQQLLDFARGEIEIKSLSELLKKGANLSVRGVEQDLSGVQPLHIAVMRGNVKAVSALIEAGANPRNEDDEGFDAINYAGMNKNYEVLAVCLLCPLKIINEKHKKTLFTEQDKKHRAEQSDRILVTQQIESAFEFANNIDNPLSRSALFHHLGMYLKDELHMVSYASRAFEKVVDQGNFQSNLGASPLKAIPFNPIAMQASFHEEAEHALAEISLVEKLDPTEQPLDIDDDSSVNNAMLHTIRARFKQSRSSTPSFDEQISRNFFDLGLNAPVPQTLTTPEGVLQLGVSYKHLRRKSVDLAQKNEELQRELEQERILRARLEGELMQQRNSGAAHTFSATTQTGSMSLKTTADDTSPREAGSQMPLESFQFVSKSKTASDFP